MQKSSFIDEIGDYAGALANVVQTGVSTYPTSYNETLDVHSKRTQASLTHDHMVMEARKQLPEKVFHWIFARQRNLFSFKDQFLIQFKKLDRKLCPSNYPTSTAELFDTSGCIDGLRGIGTSLPLVSVGYVMKPMLGGIEGVFATFVQNHRSVWVHRLDNEEQIPQSVSILSPNDPSLTRPSRIRRASDHGTSATGA